MQKTLILLSFLVISLVGHAQVRIDFSGLKDKIKFKDCSIYNKTFKLKGMARKCGWQGDKADYNYYCKAATVSSAPQEIVLSFTPQSSGTVTLFLKGEYAKINGIVTPVQIAYEKISAEGTTIKNPDFAIKGKSGIPEAWKIAGKPADKKFFCFQNTPELFGKGKNYIVVWHNTPAIQDIPVTKGQKVALTISLAKYEATKDSPKAVTRFKKISPDNKSMAKYNQEFGVKYPYKQRQGPEYTKDYPRYLDHAPWKGTYKKPDPLTAADVVGPDGIVYPNFSYSGMTSEYKEPTNIVKLKEFGAVPGKDIYQPLNNAVKAAVKQGGAIIRIEPGKYILSHPVLIKDSNIIIKGSGNSGPQATTIHFSYDLKDREIKYYSPSKEGQTLGAKDRIAVHARLNYPKNGKEKSVLTLFLNGKKVRQMSAERYVTGLFELAFPVAKLEQAGLISGSNTLSTEVTWKDGTVSKLSRSFVYDPAKPKQREHITAIGALIFEGKCPSAGAENYPQKEWSLLKMAKRGGKELELAETPKGLKPGMLIYVCTTADNEWLKQINARKPFRNAIRRTMLTVEKVDGKVVKVKEPLRMDFPATQTWVAHISPIINSGVQSLKLFCDNPTWISSMFIRYAWNCQVKDVIFIKPGRNAIDMKLSKNSEIRNVEVHDAWYKDGGGTNYFAFETTFDCVADGIKASKMRHAPNFQWGSTGCVIRNGYFKDSDMQLHAGWPVENLVENCTIISRSGNGSYGYGIFINGPMSTIHGPQGPRNVVYNSKVNSIAPCIWLGGSDEGYVFAYNTFTCYKGPAIVAQLAAFDHTFIGNEFFTYDPDPAAVLLTTPDCTGNDFIDNIFHGKIKTLFAGAIKPAVDKNNKIITSPTPVGTKPPVPSIYLWQKQHCK